MRLLFLIILCSQFYQSNAMVIESTPEEVGEILYKRGLYHHYTMQNRNKAYQYYYQATQRGHMNAWRELSDLVNFIDKDLAKQYLLQYLEIKKNKEGAKNDATLMELGVTYYKIGNNAQAIDNFQLAKELGSINACKWLSSLYKEQGDIDSAEYYHTEAVKMNKGQEIDYNSTGCITQ